jgi:two-component system chemotaxis response regulator CheB
MRAVAIGCSTGGPQALAALVRRLPSLPVPVLVVQHMPAGFTAMLADHLDRLGGPPSAEARDGEALRPGRLYLAPGDRHLLVEAGPAGLSAQLSGAPAENFCRPAVDPLLRSLVAACGGAVLAAILTGMGQDGLAGCRAVAAAGGQVLAQDEASSVVWGMPGAVARAGLAAALLPPEALAERIAAIASGGVAAA